MFKEYLPIRTSNNPKFGKVLNDIESHIKENNVYRDDDRVTSGHEMTHGINSDLRQKFSNTTRQAKLHSKNKVFAGNEINAFYCLEDRCCIISEPNTKISDVAKLIPKSLRGGVYDLYLIKSQGDWNNQSLYLCDEWVAYSNGSACGLDLAEKGLWGTTRRAETIAYMLEFDVYVLTLAYIINKNDSGYDDKVFKRFVNWNFERSMLFLKESKKYPAFSDGGHDEYMERFKKDGGVVYDFAQTYLRNELPSFGTEEYL